MQLCFVFCLAIFSFIAFSLPPFPSVKVASSEADVTRANALETARPCKEFVQLLGPIPRGLRLLPFKPTVKPPSAEELAKRKEAAEAEETLRLNAIAAAELAGLPPPEPEPEPEPEDDGSFAALEAEEAVSDCRKKRKRGSF
jgi:hypothetical protein